MLQTVFERDWLAIRGNHEIYLLDHVSGHQQPEMRRHWRSLPLLQHQLGDAWLQRIAAMPDELTLRFPDAPPLRVLHAAPGDHFHALTRLSDAAAARRLLAGVAERHVVSGHYHLSFARHLAGWQVINPGSAGAPMDGNTAAGYAILHGHADGWAVEHRRVPVDLAPLFAEFERQRYVRHCGVPGFLFVEHFRQARPILPAFRRWHRDRYPDQPWSLAQAQEFLASGQLWRYLRPEYRFNHHPLAPVDGPPAGMC